MEKVTCLNQMPKPIRQVDYCFQAFSALCLYGRKNSPGKGSQSINDFKADTEIP